MPNQRLLNEAIRLRTELAIREHNGTLATAFYVSEVQPAVKAALQDGWHPDRIHSAADRGYKQWRNKEAGRR